MFDGIEIPSTNADSRGPFYGKSCYLTALASLLERNTSWTPVAVDVQDDAILLDCRGGTNFTAGNLALLSRHFGLPAGWAIKAWSVSQEPYDEVAPDEYRLLSLYIWLDKGLCLAGNGGQVPTETLRLVERGKEDAARQRRGEY